MVRKRNKKKAQQKAPEPSDFLMGESSNLMGLITGNTTLPGQKKATLGDVLAHEENARVFMKLAYTSFMMFTIPPAVYYVCLTALPRLYPEMPLNFVQMYGGFGAVGFVLLICIMYVISAFNE
eukprot:CAMPEP_0114628060 /NCGR_PEP_ID=MMETSP0168-20121206/12621_1 /TAXON_ID=95228 ORGANISM="Vannella sp., Strain DIVA3 517/6/12" /NCGR_SAMPLE_ID=MMETSP0168 /ASSEMBLY_ACC=CAM_ASM_000044 /LENGTH=122 /DNA_ID=CAMNT_0001839421 /DNA_START=29 /DNA_END=397 /DNA_ORIENTATION=+